MGPTNEDRAAWAETALLAFAAETNQIASGDWEHEPELVISDFLSDLMHFCQQRGIDFQTCLDRGRGHYEYELEEEE